MIEFTKNRYSHIFSYSRLNSSQKILLLVEEFCLDISRCYSYSKLLRCKKDFDYYYNDYYYNGLISESEDYRYISKIEYAINKFKKNRFKIGV